MMPKGLRLSVGTKSRALGSKSSTSTAAISSFLTPGDDPLSSPHAASGLLPLLPISNVSIVISPFQRICSPRHREGKVPLLAGRTNAGSHGVGANLVKLQSVFVILTLVPDETPAHYGRCRRASSELSRVGSCRPRSS